MNRVADFRVGELRIPADRFPLPGRVLRLISLYCGPGQWDGPPYAPTSHAVFECPVYRLEELEREMARVEKG